MPPATARKWRRQPLRAWARRLDTSVPTLMKMEKADTAVSIDVYATALWIIGRREALAIMADPKEDAAALENEVSAAAPPYSAERLTELARRCTLQEDNASKVECQVLKAAGAWLLAISCGKKLYRL